MRTWKLLGCFLISCLAGWWTAIPFRPAIQASGKSDSLEMYRLVDVDSPEMDDEMVLVSPQSMEDALSRTTLLERIWALSSLAENMDITRLETEVWELRNLDEEGRLFCLRPLLLRWFELESERAWAFCQEQEVVLLETFGDGFWAEFVSALGEVDPIAAAAKASLLREPFRGPALEIASKALAEVKPREGYLYALRASDPDLANRAEGFMDLVLDRDALSKDDFFQRLRHGRFTDKELKDILCVLAKEQVKDDEAMALQWVKNLPSPRLRDAALAGVVEALAEETPRHARKLLEEQPGWYLNKDAVLAVSKAFAREGRIQEAVDWLFRSKSKVPRNDRFSVASELIEATMRSDPMKAASIAAQIAPLTTTASIDYATIGGRLADDNVGTAWKWLTSLQGRAIDRRGVAEVIMLRWGRTDLAGAIKAFEGLDASLEYAGPIRSGMMTGIAESFGSNDPQAGLDWLRGLESKEMAAGSEALMKSWFDKDPDAAKAQVLTETNPILRRQMVSGIASFWSEYDPAGVATWLATLPTSDQSGPQITSTIKSWSQIDPLAASEWLATMPLKGDFRDRGAAALVREVGTMDPTIAEEWAFSIENEPLRNKVLVDFYVRWQKHEPDAASQSMSQKIDHDLKQRVEETLAMHRTIY